MGCHKFHSRKAKPCAYVPAPPDHRVGDVWPLNLSMKITTLANAHDMAKTRCGEFFLAWLMKRNLIDLPPWQKKAVAHFNISRSCCNISFSRRSVSVQPPCLRSCQPVLHHQWLHIGFEKSTAWVSTVRHQDPQQLHTKSDCSSRPDGQPYVQIP